MKAPKTAVLDLSVKRLEGGDEVRREAEVKRPRDVKTVLDALACGEEVVYFAANPRTSLYQVRQLGHEGACLSETRVLNGSLIQKAGTDAWFRAQNADLRSILDAFLASGKVVRQSLRDKISKTPCP